MRWLAAPLLLLATGCSDQRSFDERYDQTASELENKARELDANLTATTGNEVEGSGGQAPGNSGAAP